MARDPGRRARRRPGRQDGGRRGSALNSGVWDAVSGKQLAGQRFATAAQNWRRIGHLIADQVYEQLTGEKGYFDTRVVFVDETGPKDKRIKRLAIMDQDGANVRLLSQGQELVLTPRFSPTNQEITYMSYTRDQPRVFIMNLETGKRELVGDFPNMTFAPRFSPDGQRVIMSLGAPDGSSSIFEMDLRSRQSRRLTPQSGSIDTAPSYSPDGRQIVFESDREGSQELYVMNSDGSGVRRISGADGGRYSTPVWSPRGDYIAFTKQTRGPVPDRRHAPGRLGRAHPDRGLPQRGPDLGAQRPGADVLPGIAGSQRRTANLFRRYHRLQRAHRSRRRRSGPIRRGRRCSTKSVIAQPSGAASMNGVRSASPYFVIIFQHISRDLEDW